MPWLLSLLVLAAASEDVECNRAGDRCNSLGRAAAAAPPFFEFAPASGAGMSDVCACTAVTGSKGEPMTFARASVATCTKGGFGLRQTGIKDGDLVTCPTNTPRIELDADGVRGIRIAHQGTNILLRSQDLTDAVWADSDSPILTPGATDPFGTSKAVILEDDDGGASAGRVQTLSVDASTRYMMRCYLKRASAPYLPLGHAYISLDGTTAEIPLVTESWSIVDVIDTSSSGTTITAGVFAGRVGHTEDVGALVYGGCSVYKYVNSGYVETAGSAVAVAGDSVTFSYAEIAMRDMRGVLNADTPYAGTDISATNFGVYLVTGGYGKYTRFSGYTANTFICWGYGPSSLVRLSTSAPIQPFTQYTARCLVDYGVSISTELNGARLTSYGVVLTNSGYSHTQLRDIDSSPPSVRAILSRVCVDTKPEGCAP